MTGVGGGSSPIRVYLLDDHELVRRGLHDLVDQDPGFTVVGESDRGSVAVEEVGRLLPDVAVLDVRLGEESGIDVCREVRSAHPEVACLMLTSYSDEEARRDAILAGASGYVLKDVRGGDLLGTIARVAAGGSLIDPEERARAVRRLTGAGLPGGGHLTVQEQRILDLIAEGLTNREIAGEMYLAEKTVKNYVSNILAKLGVHRRTEAAIWALRNREG